MGEEEERPMERGPPGSEDGGNMPSISAAHLGPVSLLGLWIWSSNLQGQRHSWAPPVEPKPHPLHTLSLFQPCAS